MIATKKTSTVILSLIIVISSFLISPLTLPAATTGPQVTQEEISRVAQDLEVKKQQYLAQQEEMVEAIGSRLLAQVENSLSIDFQVQESQAVNAGATFGKIVVTTGMIKFTRFEDELAVVLGHEIAHVAKGHITKTIISNIPLIIGSVLAERAAPGAGKLVQLGGSIFTQKFSRDMEREADYFGILYAHKAGFDVGDGIEIWERFAIELPENQRATIFSSHPSSTERLARARKISDTLQGRSRAKAPHREETPEIIGPVPMGQRRQDIKEEHRPSQWDKPGRITEEVVAKRDSRIIHRPSCRLLSGTDPKDLIRFRSKEEAITSGGWPCEVCRP
ncbi:MAG: M48 family metallopeptidase [Candidatus Brocadiales bacterium]